MRTSCLSVFVAEFLVSLGLGVQAERGQGRGNPSPEAQAAAARYAEADIRVMVPGVVANAGIGDLAAAYTKETGKKVAITTVGMGTILNAVKTANPPADVMTLPFELMSTLSLDGGVVPGTFMPLGRSEMGLAVPAGKPHPDIYLRAAKKLGISPEACLVIEDALAGIAAGKAANMRVAAIPDRRFVDPREYEMKADHVLGSLSEIPALIRRVNAATSEEHALR